MKLIALSFALCSFALPATANTGDLQISEILASNNAAYSPDGGMTFPDAIEIQNLTDSPINLTGYGLSDSDSKPLKWTFPANTILPGGEYLVVLANDADDGLATSFKLSAGGEVVLLSSPAGEFIDRISFPQQATNISYGRLADCSLSFFTQPTIGSVNDEAFAVDSLLKRPQSDQESGIYTGSLSINLDAAEGATIHFTIDGSTPSTSSPVWTEALNITSTTVLKAIAVKDDLVSDMAMRSFLFDISHQLPVVLLTAERFIDRKDVMDDFTTFETIYSAFDIDGRVRFDFLEADGSLPISQYVEFETSGNTSRYKPPLNGKLKANAKFGKDALKHRFFPERKEQSFQRVALRNCSQDFSQARMRDGITSRFISDEDVLDIEFEAYRPVVVYVNGRYLGHMNLREDDDTAFAKQYFGLKDPFTIDRNFGEDGADLFTMNTIPNPGSSDVLERLDRIQDIDEALLNDAIRGSMQAREGTTRWIPGDPNQQRHIALHDFDLGFDYDRLNSGTWGFLDWPFNFSMTGNNRHFWNETVQFTAAYLHLMSTDERWQRIIDMAADELRPEMQQTIDFYLQRRVDVGRSPAPGTLDPNDFLDRLFILRNVVPKTLSDWETEVQIIRDRVTSRLNGSLEAIRQAHSLPALIEVTFESNDDAMGGIRVHAFKTNPESGTGKYFSTLPIRLQAEPRPGHAFVRWEGSVSGTDPAISPSFDSASTVHAVFEPTGIPIATSGNFAISEIHYNPPGFVEAEEFLELVNLSDETIDLGGVYFQAGVTYRFPEGTMLAANARIVLRPTDYEGGLSNGGETLTLVDANDALIESVQFNDGKTWPKAADGDGYSLVRISPDEPASEATSWRLSQTLGGSPGAADERVIMDMTSEGILRYTFGDLPPTLDVIHKEGGALELIFSKEIATDDVILTLMSSEDLEGMWTPVPDVEFLSKQTPIAGKELISIPLPQLNLTSRFYRLEVTLR